jgi:hypothetical protein
MINFVERRLAPLYHQAAVTPALLLIGISTLKNGS